MLQVHRLSNMMKLKKCYNYRTKKEVRCSQTEHSVKGGKLQEMSWAKGATSWIGNWVPFLPLSSSGTLGNLLNLSEQ